MRGGDETVYLASSPDAVPPSIVAVQRVAGGIAVTFSKPMDPATVENIHNYAVKFSPSQNFSLEDLTGVGLVQTLDNTKQPIALSERPTTPPRTLSRWFRTEQLGSRVRTRSAAQPSLLAKRYRPKKARRPHRSARQPARGRGNGSGVFSITISKGNPTRQRRPFSRTEVDRRADSHDGSEIAGKTGGSSQAWAFDSCGASSTLGCGVPQSLGLTWV